MLQMEHRVLHMDTPSNSRRVADAVRERLRELGKTQLDIVDATGIPRTTLNRRMTGLSPFTITELELIAAFLDTTPSKFLTAAEAAA
jgi:transcriptional regulator with XRE-family HTH domain